ncbi:MAG: hypothetical protein D6791_15185, partial [Chloroflexi bacterium]
MIVDLAGLERSVAVCPPGQSGHPGSPHYADQLPDWLAGRHRPMLWQREGIGASAEGVLTLRRAPWTGDDGRPSPPAPAWSRVVDVLIDAGRRLTAQLAGDRSGSTRLPPEVAYERPDPEYAYTVFWVKQTREWDETKRQAMAAALSGVVNHPDFQPNPVERRYTVPGLEGQYSGLSLLALARVLSAWQDAPADE